jgi:hypothetical protein
LAEKSRGRTRLVIMAWPTIFWLASAWDYLTNNEIVGENWKTFRIGCYSYIVQRRKNSFGNFLELSKYGGKGRRSYMIILDGYEGKGWEEGRLQLQRLKLEGKKGGGQTSGVTKETKQVEVQVQRSYAETVVGVQGMGGALDSQAAGKVAAENLALQDMECLENQESIKETLLSLQKQISSYLRKLELCWGKKEKETEGDQVVEGDGLKTRAPSGEEAGLGFVQPIQIVDLVDKPTRQYIISRYHKIYVCRNPPRRQVRWRPIGVGRKDQPETEELLEECQSG